MSTAVIIVAAGSGTRLGAAEPKAFVELGGRSLLTRSVDAALGMSTSPRIVVVAPGERLDDARGHLPDGVAVVAGGSTRQLSVAAGITALAGFDDISVVLVHDAARPFTPSRVFDAVEAEVRRTGLGVVPALPVVDTIKQTDAAGRVESTVDRSRLRAVQTPQGFPRAELVAAYAGAVGAAERADGAVHTDDAALFAAAGHDVTVIDGDALAFKVTTPGDLERARQLLGSPQTLIGMGVDVHAFAAEGGDEGDDALWLGDLEWPGERALAGHSDGDVLSHAVCDALLSASGLGDIGSVFGTGEARFEGAHGAVFIAETVALVTAAGFTIGNVAVQVLGNRPRISERRVELQAHLSELVGAPVRVSASTTDGLGFAGRGEGVTAVATALLVRRGESAAP